jgi:hypothetical protein
MKFLLLLNKMLSENGEWTSSQSQKFKYSGMRTVAFAVVSITYGIRAIAMDISMEDLVQKKSTIYTDLGDKPALNQKTIMALVDASNIL